MGAGRFQLDLAAAGVAPIAAASRRSCSRWRGRTSSQSAHQPTSTRSVPDCGRRRSDMPSWRQRPHCPGPHPRAADIAKAKAALAELLLPTLPRRTRRSMPVGDTLRLCLFLGRGQGTVSELSLGAEPGLLKYTLTDAGIDFASAGIAGSITVIDRRINELDLVSRRRKAGRRPLSGEGLRRPRSRTADGYLGNTGRMTLRLVDQSMPSEEALTVRPAGRHHDPLFGRRSATAVSRRGPRHLCPARTSSTRRRPWTNTPVNRS